MEQKYKSLQEIFANPPNEFRMMPFWFWNHEMVEKEITRQIQDHFEHGIGGEFIHPRHGRLTPYMSQRWLETVEAAADKCKELEMPCFLYDEDNWPSGPAGGYITGPHHPENLGKFLSMFDENVFEGPAKVDYKLDYEKIGKGTQFYAAIAVPNPLNYPDFSGVINQAQDVSKFVKNEVFSWDVPEGEWCVVFFCMLTNSPTANLNGYIDVLRKETVKEFIDFTHKKYADYFIKKGKKDYLGTVIPGIFTDEPSMAHNETGGGQMLKWITFTPEFPKKFKEMYGYDFNLALVSLFYNTGAISAKHRCQYWACLIQMYVDAFYKQIYEYCDTINWRFTGHVNGEGAFPGHIKNQGDFFKVFQYMHYGGCDQLTEDVRPDGLENLWNVKTNPYTGFCNEMMLASKLASSAAHLLGKPRVLVEAFGTSAWDIRMASAKRVNDFLILTGCDLFVPHSFNISEDSYRKGDHPAAFNYQPYYAHWKKLADHNARLCAIFNAHSGVLQPDVLLFYPAKTFHAEMDPTNSEATGYISSYFNHNADCLFRQQLDFELANEEMITASIIEKGTFKIRDERFKALFLGVATCVNIKFAQWVKQYYDAGGKIVANLLLPYKEENTGESDAVAKIFQEVFGVEPKQLVDDLKNTKSMDFTLHIQENQAGGQAILIQGPTKDPFYLAYYPTFEEVCRMVLPLSERRCIVWRDEGKQQHAAYVMQLHKEIDGKHFFFLANTSRTIGYKDVKVTFRVNAEKIEKWDTFTGEIKPFECYAQENGAVTMKLNYPPYQSDVFVITPSTIMVNKANPMEGHYTPKRLLQSIDLGKDWNCKLNAPNATMLYMKWQSSYELESGAAWGYRSVRTFSHKFQIKDRAKIPSLKLVIEGIVGDYAWGWTTQDPYVGDDYCHFTWPHNVEILVNDQSVPIKFDFNVEYLDAYWVVVDISKMAKEGENEVKMVCRTHNHGTFHVVTDPWKLIGPFEAEESDGIPKLKQARETVSLGDLNSQGFARYHGGFSYLKSVNIPADADKKRIALQVDGITDVVEVHVNGKLAGVMWKEWECDISAFVHCGNENQIELIYYGIAQNNLQTNVKPSGILGKVCINIYTPK